MDSCTSNSVFSMPIWFICNCCSACCCNTSGMTMHLPFMMMPSVNCHVIFERPVWSYILVGWSLLSGHPAIIKDFNHCRCLSCMVAHCIHWINVQSGTYVDVCTVSTHMSIPLIASSLFSLWLCQNSQSAIKLSSPGLYIILILY